MYEYPYRVAKLHSILMTFFVKIVCLKFCQGNFHKIFQGIAWCDLHAQVSVSCCHIAFNFNHIFCGNYAPVKVLWREFSSQCTRNFEVHRGEYTYHISILHLSLFMFSMIVMFWLNIYQEDIFISMFVKEMSSGVCGHEYSYYVVTSHSAAIPPI
jgi:hypothetical protein